PAHIGALSTLKMRPHSGEHRSEGFLCFYIYHPTGPAPERSFRCFREAVCHSTPESVRRAHVTGRPRPGNQRPSFVCRFLEYNRPALPPPFARGTGWSDRNPRRHALPDYVFG